MHRDDVMHIVYETQGQFWMNEAHIQRFAKRLLEIEREACADICDQHASVEGIAQRCAEAIRARGQA